MNRDLASLFPEDRKVVAERARQSGQAVEQVVAQLVHRALEIDGGEADRPKTGFVDDPAYAPARTELGRTLRALRRRYLEIGGQLASTDAINAEVAEGRGL